MTRTGKSVKNSDNGRKVDAQAGFTLMEVLIAITILSVGLLAIASMQISAIQTTGGAKSVSKGILLAEDRMEYLISRPYSPTPPTTVLSAGVNKPDPLTTPAGFTITYDVVNNNPTPNCKLITISVQWTDRGVNKTTTLTSVKAQL